MKVLLNCRGVMDKLAADIERISVETETDEQLLRLIVALDAHRPSPAPSPGSSSAAEVGERNGVSTSLGNGQASLVYFCTVVQDCCLTEEVAL